MKRWVIISTLCASLYAQTNGFRPDFVQSFLVENPGSGAVAYQDNVVSGDLLVGCAAWSAAGLTLGVSDTRGTSYTLTSAMVLPSAVTIQMWYGVAPTSGADTVTISGISNPVNMVIAEFKNISANLDVTGTVSTTASLASLTVTPTTTVNGDLIVPCVSAGSGGNTTNFYASFPQQTLAGDSGNCCAMLLEQANLGLAGAQSLTVNNNTFSYQPAKWGIIAPAFKPAAISIATSVLPDGAQTTAYQACLVAVGGTGAYTWSVLSGLPAWASINSSTGCVTGTPNVNATNAINFQVTDGSVTATRTLNLKTGSSFNTPSLVQFKNGTISETVTTTGSVNKNNVLFVVARSTTGLFIMPTSGSGNFISDSLGTVFTRVYPITDVVGNSIVEFVGIAPACGVDTITYTNSAGNGFYFQVQEWTGVQPVIDDGANATVAGFSASPGSLTTGNYTAQVANEMLLETANEGTGADTITVTAPFTTIFNGIFNAEVLAGGYNQATTATTYTSNVTDTSASPHSDLLSLQLVGLRPAIAGPVGCGTAGIRHKAQEY